MRKAQIQSQVIVYILAVITMGMILLFGFMAISNMKETVCMNQKVMFQKDLKSDIAAIGGDYGSSKIRNYQSPCGDYRKVCIVNLEYNEGDVRQILETANADPIIQDAVRDILNPDQNYERNNLFLCPPCVEQIYLGNITITDGGLDTAYKCFNITQGRLSLRVTGMGNRAQISSAK